MTPKEKATLRKQAAEAAGSAVEKALFKAGIHLADDTELAAEALLLAVSIACGPHEAARMIAYCSSRHWER